jgi:hypothetical protein
LSFAKKSASGQLIDQAGRTLSINAARQLATLKLSFGCCVAATAANASAIAVAAKHLVSSRAILQSLA